MIINQDGRQFRFLTAHCVLWSLAISLAGGFVSAYLLHLGFSIAETIVLYALLLSFRFAIRAVMLPVVRRLGIRRAMLFGTVLSACQYLALIKAEEPLWLGVWVLIVSAGECIYWPICHAANAVCGGDGRRRGRQIAFRQMAGTVIAVIGPIAGGTVMTRLGPGAEFGIATVVCLVSIVPLLWIGRLDLGIIPTVRQSLKVADPVGLWAFAADGWMCAGVAFAWPMILFSTLGSSYGRLGWASGAAAIAAAVAGLGCGFTIDRGYRPLLSRVVSLLLLASFALRALSAWAPDAILAVNVAGAAVSGLYYPVLMSVVYDRAKRSGSAYQFHLSAEAGWDAGAILGCLATAAVIWTGLPITLAVLPSALAVLVVHHCVRAETRITKTEVVPVKKPVPVWA